MDAIHLEDLAVFHSELGDVEQALTLMFWAPLAGFDVKEAPLRAMTGHPGGFYGDYFPRPRMED